MRTAWAWFSARDLLWVTLFALGSGILLLIPVFVGAQRVPARLVDVLRGLHSASSVLLVVGALGHAVMRGVRAAMSTRAITSGILASTTIGLAVVTGSMASAPEWWADELGWGADALENLSSVFHFGYSAAILLALVFWHVRPSRGALLAPPEWSTAAVAALILVAAVATVSDAVPALLTILIAPMLAVGAWWTVFAPQFLWFFAWRRSRKPAEPGP